MMWTTQLRSEGVGHLAYWREGEGPPLVLIHGVGLQAEAWAAVMPVLGQRFTVYAIDMPGHGKSPLKDAKALSNYVARVREFIQSLNQPAIVAGHSMGAMIALDLASAYPGNIVGAAALNAIFRRTSEAAEAVQSRANALISEQHPSPDATLKRWFGASPEGHLSDATQACRTWLTGCDPVGYATAYKVFAHHDGPDDDQLQGLAMPVLFQTGSHDRNSTPEMSRHMAALTPKGAADIVSDAAHMMPMTHPEAVAEALLQTFGQTA